MNLDIVFKSLGTFAWLIFFGVIFLTVTQAARGKPTKSRIPILVGLFVAALLLSSVVFLEPNTRGVVISPFPEGGVRSSAMPGGLNFKIPLLEKVVIYPTSNQVYTVSIAHEEGDRSGDDSIEARTSDGQVVNVDATVIFKINPSRVIDVHIAWENRYTEDLIRTELRGVIRDKVAKFQIEEVYSSKRQELSDQIQVELTEKLDKEGFILGEFVLRNIAFSDEYSASVEQKQIAEQLAQQAAFVVEQRFQEAEQARQQAQGEADAVVIKAEGQAQALILQAQAEAEARLIQANAEAQALQLLGQAIRTNPDVLTLLYIEKLAPSIQVMLLPSDNPFLLPLPGLSP